ncbi:hypothetical protein GCM10018784_40700 [Streptomyces hydrogenans]|nr:hypothetical protein GCM10018784_40700 [Streptomyces hydrogenans]
MAGNGVGSVITAAVSGVNCGPDAGPAVSVPYPDAVEAVSMPTASTAVTSPRRSGLRPVRLRGSCSAMVLFQSCGPGREGTGTPRAETQAPV